MTKTIRTGFRILPFLTLACMAACGRPQPVTCKAPTASAGAEQQVVLGNTQFAADLLAQLAQQQSGQNFFYSPYSISASLAMTYAGAGSQTAQQMAQVLHLMSSAQDVPLAFAQLDCQIETNGQDNDNQLDLANGLFGQQGFSYEPAFLDELQSDYGAPLQQVDFKGNTHVAIQTIDQWVSAQTQGLIPQLLADGSLSQNTRLALADAIYFKGSWASAFDPANTQEGAFSVTATQQVQTPFMNVTDNFAYVAGQDFSIVELPYKGGKIAMDVVLPDAVDGLPKLIGSFNATTFSGWLAQLQQSTVQVRLPKLTIKSSFDLKATLQAMGMSLAFDQSSADFSGMDGQHDLFLDAVVHQATVTVDETGTVAVAATVSSGDSVSGSVEPWFFDASHPFLLVLRELDTGTVLFVGQVTNPAQ